MSDTWIPIFVALSIMGLFIGFFHYNSRTKRSLHTAVEKALEKGEKLTPELLKTLQTPSSGKYGDFRKGVLWLAVGAALALLGILNPGEHGHNAAYFAFFPVFIGIGYIVIWKLNPEKDG
jgi:hypothetical protein